MRKKLLSALLSLVLIVSVAPNAACAASDEAVPAANALYQLGLFNGTGTDAQGNPIFDLDRSCSRHEAVTMLVRLLGRAGEAVSNPCSTPFTDVAEWAKPYVGYAYANKLTSGTSAAAYGGSENVTASQYITFVLRALGYENGTDFQWDKAWELSDKLGITGGQYNAGTVSFTRGDVVIISFHALSAKVKDKDTTLFEDLTARGIVKAHTHNYTAPAAGGHYEQVQVGTEQVIVRYEDRLRSVCTKCGFETYDTDELREHQRTTCFSGRQLCYEEKVPIYETQPVYENQWVEDTIRVCSICGQKEP